MTRIKRKVIDGKRGKVAHDIRIALDKELALLDFLSPEQRANAGLVIGETVTNALFHAPEQSHVRIGWENPGNAFHLIVSNSGDGFVTGEPSLPETLSECGRGCYLLRALIREINNEQVRANYHYRQHDGRTVFRMSISS